MKRLIRDIHTNEYLASDGWSKSVIDAINFSSIGEAMNHGEKLPRKVELVVRMNHTPVEFTVPIHHHPSK